LWLDDAVWDATTFTKNRDRLLTGDIATAFLREVLAIANDAGVLSNEHFTVDGTLLEAAASQKSCRPRDDDPRSGSSGNADVNFRGGPLLHWTMYAIPAAVTKLAAGMKDPPAGASYGPNVRGPNQAYMGPHTPPDAKHHYHFAILALDRDIPVNPALGYDALAADISGHVLASGEVVGLGHAPPDAPPFPKPVPATPAPAAPSR